MKNKLDVLNQSAQSKREKTFIKVKSVLKVMKDKSLPINFESVAKLAQVSKTWLYKEPLISTEIRKVRAKGGIIQRTLDYRSVIEKKEEELAKLKIKNKAMQEEIKHLKEQLEIVHGELFKLKSQYKIKVIQ